MRVVLFVLSLILFTSATGQEKRMIIDRNTGLPVSYVTVRSLNSPKATISNALGEFKLEVASGDSVLFSCAGYQNNVVLGKDIGKSVYLEPRIIELKTVVVGSNISFPRVKLGNENNIVSGDTRWVPHGLYALPMEFAQKIVIAAQGSGVKLEKLFIPVKKSKCFGPILVRIYQADALLDQPGMELFSRVINPDTGTIKRSALIIDVTTANIFFNRNDSLFVSVSWLPDAQYEDCNTCVLTSSKSSSITYSRSPTPKTFEWRPELNPFKNSIGKDSLLRTFYSVEVAVYP